MVEYLLERMEKDNDTAAEVNAQQPTKISITDNDDQIDEQATENAVDQELANEADKIDLKDDDVEENGLLDDEPEDGVSDEPELETTSDNSEIDPAKTIEELDEAALEKSQHDVFAPDPEVDAAVDDIVRAESDEVIADVDAKIAAGSAAKSKKTIRQKIAAGFGAWWHHKIARYTTLVLLFGGLIACLLIPTTRYGMLNIVGVRVASSMTVIDAQTRLPLKNISVELQDKSAKTDDEGKVQFDGLKLGKSELAITKVGYADNTRDIILGWGSNPIGDQELVATGEQFIFIVTDWLNGEPLKSAEAESGESSAKADEEGKITLTVGEEGLANADVKVRAENYREEVLSLTDLNEQTELKLVPSRRHAFVSNRSGQFDLYTIDVDAKNEHLLLPATGKEREVPTTLPHPTRDVLAFISSRSGEQNSDGFIVDELFLIDTVSGESDRIARSEQLQLVGWHEDTLVFWQVIEGTSRANAERSKLISYNQVTGERLELAGANYFNDVRLVGGTVYYAVSSFAVPQSQAKLFTIQTDGTNRIKLIDSLVYNIFRSSYETLLFAADNQKWYQQVGQGIVEEAGVQPQPQNKRFVDSPNGERTAWVEVRDGKGVLLMSNIASEDEEQSVLALPGLDTVTYWLNDHTLVFRVIRNTETADYVINVDDPTEMKIVDVTASTRLYY